MLSCKRVVGSMTSDREMGQGYIWSITVCYPGISCWNFATQYAERVDVVYGIPIKSHFPGPLVPGRTAMQLMAR